MQIDLFAESAQQGETQAAERQRPSASSYISVSYFHGLCILDKYPVLLLRLQYIFLVSFTVFEAFFISLQLLELPTGGSLSVK